MQRCRRSYRAVPAGESGKHGRNLFCHTFTLKSGSATHSSPALHHSLLQHQHQTSFEGTAAWFANLGFRQSNLRCRLLLINFPRNPTIERLDTLGLMTRSRSFSCVSSFRHDPHSIPSLDIRSTRLSRSNETMRFASQ
ncbi:hypothetical protein RJ55_01005 [Drechmeria coniospora]|nr:hypothetical protein RJ55_01005 [Drechmeria coniospora]